MRSAAHLRAWLGIAGLVMGITAAGIMVIVMILGVANYIFTMNNF